MAYIQPPGYTIYGIDLPFIKAISAATDERVIGHTCILPDDVEEIDLQKLLSKTNPPIDSSTLKVLKWSSYEILGSKPWFQYKGLWGEEATLKGWDGPKGPARRKWSITPNRIQTIILQSLGGQRGGFIYKNWHGIPS